MPREEVAVTFDSMALHLVDEAAEDLEVLHQLMGSHHRCRSMTADSCLHSLLVP